MFHNLKKKRVLSRVLVKETEAADIDNLSKDRFFSKADLFPSGLTLEPSETIASICCVLGTEW